jgi:serine/threonine protein kinase
MGYRASFNGFGGPGPITSNTSTVQLPRLHAHFSEKASIRSYVPEQSVTLNAFRLEGDDRFISSYGRNFNLSSTSASGNRPTLDRSRSLGTLRPTTNTGKLDARATLLGNSRRLSTEASVSLLPGIDNSVGSVQSGPSDPWERRRAIVELLASQDLQAIAKRAYKAHDADGNNYLEFAELRSVLQSMEREYGLPVPDTDMMERLFKRFDINGDERLDFDEFFALFVAGLRRTAFEKSSFLGRSFFVSQQPGNIWDVYENVKMLGSGSFGEAYHVRRRLLGSGDGVQRRRLGEERVVKVVGKSRARMPLEDIEREIILLRQVDHPHIVRLFEWYEDDRSIYLVMDFCRGGTLKAVVVDLQSRQPNVKEEWARKVMKQVMEAMDYCHKLRLIHRDLKDENIMLLGKDDGTFTSDPFVVIIDLGVAEMFSKADVQVQGIGGTPLYMAPETWTNTFGPKCDVWSSGVILYNLLSGNMPFFANSMKPASWRKALKKQPNWNCINTSGASKALCGHMLTFRESDRFSMGQCLQHRWFSQHHSDPNTVATASFAGLKDVIHEAAVKRAIMFEIASRLPIDQAQQVVQIFDFFDADRSGSVSLEELNEAFKKLGVEDESLAKKTFTALDVNQSGSLTFSELASGILTFFRELVEERLHMLFLERWDGQGDGLDTYGLHAFLESAARLQSTSGPRSVEIVRSLERASEQRRVRFEELRDLILGPPPPRPEV